MRNAPEISSLPALCFDSIVQREKGLHRSLSTGQVSMIAIGGAIGTGLFLGSGFAIHFAGPSVLVSYGIGALIALLLMGCLAEMTVEHPTAGSFGAYAEYYIGPLAGFLVRYAYWFAVVGAVGTEVTAVAVYMRFWYPNMPGWLWIVAFSVALVSVNAVNVGVFGKVEYAFSLLKIVVIFAFIIMGAVVVLLAPPGSEIGFHNYTARGGFFPHGLWGMWVAVIVSIFSYLSIEMIAVAAGEARDPQNAVTSAFRVTVFRLILFYLVTIALMLAIVPWNANEVEGSPFVKVMRATYVPGAAGIMNFVVLIAALSAMNSQLYITTRMMFSLSRAGYAPSSFGRLSPRSVPVSALLVSTIGIALATLLIVLYPQTSFTLMMSLAMFGALFTWLMIFVTHLFFRTKQKGKTLKFRMWGYPYLSLLGAALMIAILLTTLLTSEFKMTIIFGGPFLLILIWIFQVRYRKPAPGQKGPATI